PPRTTPGQPGKPGRNGTGAAVPAGMGRSPGRAEPPSGPESPADRHPERDPSPQAWLRGRGPAQDQPRRDTHPAGPVPRGSHQAVTDPGSAEAAGEPASQRARQALRDLVVSRALDLLSGPSGLAAWLRASRLDG